MISMAHCLEQASKKKWIPIAEEVISSKRLYFAMPIEMLVNKLCINHYWNEIIMADIKVKVYFDIDDKESKTLEESQNKVKNLIQDYSSFMNLTPPRVCTITSHGMLSDGKIKFSYTVIFVDCYFNNNQDQKNIMKLFLTKVGSKYDNIVDTSVYNKNSNLRMVNQIKRGQTRVNKLINNDFAIIDTIISYTKNCCIEVMNDKLKKVVDAYLAKQQKYVNYSTDTSIQQKCKPLLVKILHKLPNNIHQDYNKWWNIVKLIKKYGDYQLFIEYNNKNRSKVDSKQNKAIWDSTDGKYFSIHTFRQCVKDDDIIKDLEWMLDLEKRFLKEKII